MNDKDISPIEQMFALEYVKDFSVARAAKDCGLDVKNLYASGYKLLKRANVQKVIAIEIGKRDQVSAVDALYVIQRLVEVIEVDIVEWALVGASGGTEEKLKSMPTEIRKLVSSIKKKVVYNHDSNETTTTFEFKMMDKNKALELLGKHLGMFDKRINISGEVKVTHNYSEWAADVRARRNKAIIDVTPKD